MCCDKELATTLYPTSRNTPATAAGTCSLRSTPISITLSWNSPDLGLFRRFYGPNMATSSLVMRAEGLGMVLVENLPQRADRRCCKRILQVASMHGLLLVQEKALLVMQLEMYL